MAAVYREDHLPEGLIPPIRINKASPPYWAGYGPELLTTGCEAPPEPAAGTAPEPAPDANTSDSNATCSFSSLFGVNDVIRKNETELFEAYHVLPGAQCFDSELAVARDFVDQQLYWPDPAHEFRNDERSGQFHTENFSSVFGSLTTDGGKEEEKRAYEDWCKLLDADFKNPLLNITLLRHNNSGSLEPKPREICTVGPADMYVYVRNCFTSEKVYIDGFQDPGLLLVQVSLDPVPEDDLRVAKDTSCLLSLDDGVEVFNEKVLLVLLAGYSCFVLLLAGVAL
jgi:hypothetical protein